MAIAYVRVSTEEQARFGSSLDAQEARITAYAAMQGLTLAAMVREEGVSGGKVLAEREGGAELLRLLRAHAAGHIIALKLDRLFRDAADALTQIRTWDRAGLALHLVDLGGSAIDTASAMGRMLITILAAAAEWEKNLIGERTAAVMGFKKSRREVYSPTPYGYQRVGTHLFPDLDELAVVERMRAMQAAGMSLVNIAATLNSESIPAKRGGQWWPSGISYILKNNLYGAAE